MAELTVEMVNAPARMEALARVEERISAHMQRAGEELLEIGRCLCEAKDKELVPHGQWVKWVREQTGMDERTAQNWMRAAREIPTGSPLARLSKTKIVALLSLPPEEREDAAREMDAAHVSSREVQRAVADRNAARKERDEALRQMRAIKDEQNKALQQLNALRNEQSKALDSAIAREAALTGERDRMASQLRDAKEEMDRLRAEARTAQQSGTEIPLHARQRIETLERELEAISDKYDDAQDQIAQLRRRRGGADQSEGMTLDKVCTACGAFMGAIGGLPQMLAGRRLTDADALVLQGQAEMIREWALRVLDSL